MIASSRFSGPSGESTPQSPVHTESRAKSQILDQAYAEYCQLQGTGHVPDPEAFCARFASIQTSLRRLLEAHHFFEENSHLLAAFRPVQWPEPGTTLLGFTLVRELGRGAFARVFLATEPALGNRQVAVKISLEGGTEAETLGRLEHPNIVPVHSVQTEELSGLFVVCMPYLGRATLCDVLDQAFAAQKPPRDAGVILAAIRDAELADLPGRRQAIPAILQRGTYVDGVLWLGWQLAEALAFIHKQGICHRDLKPSNVLLAANGRPMLLDFNLSVDENAADQRLGGTLPYMSPEQLLATDLDRCQEAMLDSRTDLFSLGVMLYELLSGRHPFGPVPLKSTSQELRKLLLQRQQAGCPGLAKVNPQVDRQVAQLIESCLAYNPNDRPASARALADQLRKSLSWRPRWRRRLAQRWRSLAVAAAAALVVAGLGVYYLMPEGTYSERALRQGETAYHEGMYPQALLHFSKALEEEPGLPRAYYLRGRAYLKMGSYRAALEQFQESARLQRHGPTLACIAYCTVLRDQVYCHLEAIQFNRQAMDEGFRSANLYSNLGYSCLLSGKYEEALEALDQAIRLNPAHQTAYHLRAKVDRQRMYMKPPGAGYIPQQGMKDIRKAIDLGPKNTDLYSDASYLYCFAARSDPQWIQHALEYLRLAVDHGVDPNWIRGNSLVPFLAKDDERYQELIKLPRRTSEIRRAVLLLDPVDDISQ